jgi:hypothetical protein
MVKVKKLNVLTRSDLISTASIERAKPPQLLPAACCFEHTAAYFEPRVVLSCELHAVVVLSYLLMYWLRLRS